MSPVKVSFSPNKLVNYINVSSQNESNAESNTESNLMYLFTIITHLTKYLFYSCYSCFMQ